MMCLSCFAFVSCSPKDIFANLHLGRNTDSSGYDHDMSVLGYENKHQVCSFLVMHSLLNPASRWLKETGSFICCFFFFFFLSTALLSCCTKHQQNLWGCDMLCQKCFLGRPCRCHCLSDSKTDVPQPGSSWYGPANWLSMNQITLIQPNW